MTNLDIPAIIDFELSNHLLNLVAFLLVIVSIKLVLAKDLLSSVITMSVFSLLISLAYLLMDAPDVAMTETALGACLSSCVYLSFLQKLPLAAKTNMRASKIIPAIIICTVFVVVLAYIGLELPYYGDVNAPLQTHLSRYYIENVNDEIGIPSFVAAILASYRGFDTLGETSVILIAGISVLLVFSKSFDAISASNKIQENKTLVSTQRNSNINAREMTPIIRNITIFVVPYILLYSLYIQLNGEASPGGGFQAGVIFASALIGYNLICGTKKLERYVSVSTLIFIATFGVLIYGCVGIISLFFNENYLDYYSLINFTEDKLSAQHLAIFIIEAGIGVTVAAIMYLIYNLFTYE